MFSRKEKRKEKEKRNKEVVNDWASVYLSVQYICSSGRPQSPVPSPQSPAPPASSVPVGVPHTAEVVTLKIQMFLA